MGNTPGGFSYPEPSAALRDGYLNIKTLAEQVEARYGQRKLAIRAATYASDAAGNVNVGFTPEMTSCLGGLVMSSANNVEMRIVLLNNGAGGIVFRTYHNDGTVFPNATMGANLILWGT